MVVMSQHDLRGKGSVLPQPSLHQVREQRQHLARLKAFEDLKDEVKLLVNNEVCMTICCPPVSRR